VGTGRHAIEIPNADVKLGNLLQLSPTASVIEPPSIGIGGPGTTAYTAQIRTFLHIFVDTNGVPLVGDLLSSITGTRIKLDLPVAIDLVGAKGTLGDLCSETDDQGRQLAPIHVDSSVLKACVGNITPDNAFSTVTSCDQIPGANENKDLLSVSLAGTSVLDLNTHFSTAALPASGDVTLYAGQTASVGNSLEIGTTVSNLFAALTTALIPNPQTTSTSVDRKEVATDLWESISKGRDNASEYGSQFSTWRQSAIGQLQSSTQGLQTILNLANTSEDIKNILGNTLSLNIPGLLDSTTNLLGSIGNTVKQILDGLLGTGCTPGLLSNGNYQSCISDIEDAIPTKTQNADYGLISVLGLLVQTLQGPLDQVGSKVLTPLLQNVLGVDLGKTDVHLQSLQCHRVQLVY
jgi:hypothetical protein